MQCRVDFISVTYARLHHCHSLRIKPSIACHSTGMSKFRANIISTIVTYILKYFWQNAFIACSKFISSVVRVVNHHGQALDQNICSVVKSSSHFCLQKHMKFIFSLSKPDLKPTFELIRVYNHCVTLLSDTTPFIPSMYNISWPRAGYEKKQWKARILIIIIIIIINRTFQHAP